MKISWLNRVSILLGEDSFSILLEIPIAMIAASRMLNYRINRFANILAGVITILWVIGGGNDSLSYVFFATIEVACMAYIVWCAWKWVESKAVD